MHETLPRSRAPWQQLFDKLDTIIDLPENLER
jgi:hypothetical protein